MKRRILTLCLILVLVVAMAVPAFAASYPATYNYNGTTYNYRYSVSRNATNASAYIGFTDTNTIYVEAHINTYITVGNNHYVDIDSAGGYGSATARTDNIPDTISVSGTITSARGYFYIFDQKVKELTV